jgi:hypothetical protein
MTGSAHGGLLVVSAGDTTGWRAASRQLVENFQRAGVAVQTASSAPAPGVRTFMLTDYIQARAARRAAAQAITAHQPEAIVYCSMTAALLWPRPGAIWLDSLAAENRPGRHGIWQRVVERRRLADAPLVMTMADTSLDPLPARARPEAITVPVAIEASGPLTVPRDLDLLAYAADPNKRRLDFILEAWGRARREGETLVVAGLDGPASPGVRFAGRLAPDEYRGLVRRARVYVAAPRREDFGIAPLEALADGCLLVTTPAPGPYPALGLARQLDSRLVADDLAPALRTALDDPRPGYAERAADLLTAFSRASVDATIAEDVLPRLLPRWSSR